MGGARACVALFMGKVPKSSPTIFYPGTWFTIQCGIMWGVAPWTLSYFSTKLCVCGGGIIFHGQGAEQWSFNFSPGYLVRSQAHGGGHCIYTFHGQGAEKWSLPEYQILLPEYQILLPNSSTARPKSRSDALADRWRIGVSNNWVFLYSWHPKNKKTNILDVLTIVEGG